MKYIVDFSHDASSKAVKAWLSSAPITAFDVIDSDGRVYLVSADTVPTKTDIITTITADVNISSQLLDVVEIIPLSTGTQSSFHHDEFWWKTASCTTVDFAEDSTQFEPRGSLSTVYMLDSGVNSDHPEFANAKMVDLFTFTDSYADNVGHGTALSSMIVGATCGIANSTLKNVKIFDKVQTTMLSDIVKGLDAVLVDLVANPNSIGIVNLSWFIPKNEYVESKIQRLLDVGATVVAAAGNSGIPIEDVTPASMEAVLTVGAYDSDFAPATFSNYTSSIPTTPGASNHGELDVWAPGVDIKGALLDGTVGNIAGTSAAAAVMTACCAYNSDMSYTKTGPARKAAVLMAMHSKTKTGLLVLSEKYKDSVNRVCTFMPHVMPAIEFGTGIITNLIYANTQNSVLIAQNTIVSKIELNIDLPDGLSLSNGWLVGTLTNPPTDKMEILEFVATITYLTGNVNEYPVKLYLLPPDIAYGDAPADGTLLVYCDKGCSGLCEMACQACDKGVCEPCGDYCR